MWALASGFLLQNQRHPIHWWHLACNFTVTLNLLPASSTFKVAFHGTDQDKAVWSFFIFSWLAILIPSMTLILLCKVTSYIYRFWRTGHGHFGGSFIQPTKVRVPFSWVLNWATMPTGLCSTRDVLNHGCCLPSGAQMKRMETTRRM